MPDAATGSAAPPPFPAVAAIPITIVWAEPLRGAAPIVLLARWLRGMLTQRHCCQVMQGRPSCVERSDIPPGQRRCLAPEGCRADWAFPLGPVPSHRMPTVLVRPGLVPPSAPAGAQTFDVVLLGEQAIATLPAAVHEVAAALCHRRGAQARTPAVAAVGVGGAKPLDLGRLARELAAAADQGWTLTLHTPWLLERDQPQLNVARAQDAVGHFARHAAQRAYKFAALALADSRRQGLPVADGPLAHAAALQARDACAADLSALSASEVDMQAVQWRELSASSKRLLEPMGLCGRMRLSPARRMGAMRRDAVARWLAVVHVLGLGEATAEGLGCCSIEAASG